MIKKIIPLVLCLSACDPDAVSFDANSCALTNSNLVTEETASSISMWICESSSESVDLQVYKFFADGESCSYSGPDIESLNGNCGGNWARTQCGSVEIGPPADPSRTTVKVDWRNISMNGESANVDVAVWAEGNDELVRSFSCSKLVVTE